MFPAARLCFWPNRLRGLTPYSLTNELITSRSWRWGGVVSCLERRTSSICGLKAAGIREMSEIRSATEVWAMLKASTMPDEGLDDDSEILCWTHARQNNVTVKFAIKKCTNKRYKERQPCAKVFQIQSVIRMSLDTLAPDSFSSDFYVLVSFLLHLVGDYVQHTKFFGHAVHFSLNLL